MNMNEYQLLAERTANNGNPDELRFANFGMGISGEAGEVTDLLKKTVFHGHPLDKNKLLKELGDVLWYVATIASTAGIDLDDVATANIEKLRERYPKGFSEADSQRRADLYGIKDKGSEQG